MQRTPEPELMNEAEQAKAYANADFEEPHNHFIELLIETVGAVLPDKGTAIDLGCGAADISIRFARAYPNYKVEGLDGAEAMLAEGEKAIRQADLTHRIKLVQSNLQESSLVDKDYAFIMSNSLLHHLHDPMVLWNFIKTGSDKTPVFIMDLMRPENNETVDWMVEEYAANEPEILKRDFANSLRAAFTQDEVEAQLNAAGLKGFTVKAVSDRHLTISR